MGETTAPRPRGRPLGRTTDYEKNRRRILDAATVLFAEGGYETTGMRELASSLGMSPAAIYHYFGSKEALMGALIDDSLRGPQRGIRRLPEGGSLRDILMSAGAGFMNAMSTRVGRQRLEVVFLAAHQRGEWAELYLSQLSDPTESGLAEAIAEALPKAARGRLNARWVAKQLIGSLLSFVLHEEVLRREGATADSREDYLRQVVDVIAAGVEHLPPAEAPSGAVTSRRSRPRR
ncbi:MAG TPA: helix-turn-helix domain-containing protein [Candidatus Dormibacteraeota bacterium]|nr:helix-turn-helix domain-containing protein [Candidatus Dormibacteraeota bacterium]